MERLNYTALSRFEGIATARQAASLQNDCRECQECFTEQT